MGKKINVAVLMGGKSKEHEISLMSGREVARNLNPRKYNILPIIVSRDGITWQIGDRKQLSQDSPTTNSKTASKKSKIKHPTVTDYSQVIKDRGIDIVFIAMHGPNGEDGKVQGFLDLIGVPYTGSGVLASSLGMDKIYSRTLFSQARLNVPRYVILSEKTPVQEMKRILSEEERTTAFGPWESIVKKGEMSDKVWQELEPPVFVKPRFQGSSVGTSKVNTKKDLKKACKKAHTYDEWAIVEEYLDGTEVTCAILGNENPKALPLVEIAPKKEYFDYEAKYDPNLTDEIVPARISKDLTKKARQAALVAYQAIGCRGFGRVDMIIRRKKVYVLEINTIPGLTPVSLFPKAANAAGISYPQLLDKIIMLSLENR